MKIPLLGTWVNVAAVVAGCVLGRTHGHLISERMRQTLFYGLGLATMLIGLSLALPTRQPLVLIGSLIIGGIAGEALDVEGRLAKVGERLQRRFSGWGRVAEGFLDASLLFCVGAMAITGSIQDGLGQAPTILYSKSALDGVASIALSATLGFGVVLSALTIVVYQGAITLAAASVQPWLTPPVVREMNAAGGLLILAIGLGLLGIKKLPVGNLLPAIFVAAGLMLGLRLS
jgi:uncharacterized protein